MEKYPTHALNGEEDINQVRDPATGKIVMAPKPSVIVPIPASRSTLESNPIVERPTLLSPQPPPSRGAGQLRTFK